MKTKTKFSKITPCTKNN